MGTRPAPRSMRAFDPWARMRAPVAVAMRPAKVSPRSRTPWPVRKSMAGSPEPRAFAQRATASALTLARSGAGAVAATPEAAFHAVSAGRNRVGGWTTGRGGGGGDGGGAVGGHAGRALRGAHPVRHGPRDALDVRGERRVVLDVIGGVLTHHVDDARAGLARVMQIGEAVAEARSQVKESGRGPSRHAPVAVGRARHDPLEEPEDAANALDLVESGHEVHLRRAGIREAYIDS